MAEKYAYLLFFCKNANIRYLIYFLFFSLIPHTHTQELNSFPSFAGGVIAGGFERFLLAPLATIRVYQQTNTKIPWENPLQLWRGSTLAASSIGVITGIQTALDNTLQSKIPQSIARSITAGVLSSYIIVNPLGLIIIQQQAHNCNISTAIKNIWQHGPLTFWRASHWAAAREACFVAGYRGLAVDSTQYLQEHGLQPTSAKLFGSLFSGLMATTLSHPFDTIKTVLSKNIEPHTRIPLLVLIKTLGFRGLFKGYTIRSVRGVLATMWLAWAIPECEKRLTKNELS